MDISGFGALITPQTPSTSSSGVSGAGSAPVQGGDRLSLTLGTRAGAAAVRDSGATGTIFTEVTKSLSPTQVVQRAVSSTTEYLRQRLEDFIGGLGDDGRFEGLLGEEMQDLAEAMQKAQDQGDGARALRLLRDQGGKLGETLAPELDALLTDTRDYFTQALTTAFGSLRIVELTGRSIGADLFLLSQNPDVDAQTAAAMLRKYDFIPASSQLNQRAAGEGVLYETQSDPSLRGLFDSIQAAFDKDLEVFFGDPGELAASLAQDFLDQGKAFFFKERRDGDPDMASALGAALDTLQENLSGSVQALATRAKDDVDEAVKHFKPKRGRLTTIDALRGMNERTQAAAKVIDFLQEVVRKAEEQTQAAEARDSAGEQAVPAATADAGTGRSVDAEGTPASVNLLV